MKNLMTIFLLVLYGLSACTQDPVPPNTDNMRITKENVQFTSEGLTLAGHLYLPAGFDASRKYTAVVTGGSLTSVKEQMAGTYAARLAEKGFVALAFDYRNYGESEGQPRQYEDPALKLQDLQSAVTYLLNLPYVDTITAVGICTSGGNMAYLAAHDSRVKAVAVIASHLSDASVLPMLYGGEARVQALRDAATTARRQFELTGENEIIIAYSNTDSSASHVGPMEYYMDRSRGGGVAQWRNEFSVISWGPWLDFDAVSKAPAITAPLIMFHCDGCALPDNARRFYAALPNKKELVWGSGYHFDYYDGEQQIEQVVERTVTFFRENLQAQ